MILVYGLPKVEVIEINLVLVSAIRDSSVIYTLAAAALQRLGVSELQFY